MADTNVKSPLANANAAKRGRKPSTPIEVESINPEVKEVADVADAYVEKVAESVPEKRVAKAPEKKTFGKEDGILCRSITAGTLIVEGTRTKNIYRFVAEGDELEIEYQDIEAGIRANSGFFMNPCLIVEDEDVIDRFPTLKALYDSMYSITDLKEILTYDADYMRTVIEGLPRGAKDSLQNIASTQIATGILDSVRKIKVLDEIFDTKMVMMTELFAE